VHFFLSSIVSVNRTNSQKVLEQDLTVIDQNRAIRYADSQQTILIVVGSFTFMIVLIWVVKRFLK
jgi:hypothetical protein